MLDFTSSVRRQRSSGTASVSLGRRDAHVRVEEFYQTGSAKAILPATHGGAHEVVFINTSGGLAGGDRLTYALTVGDGLRVTGTTQTAERAYAAHEDVAKVRVSLRAGRGAILDWLPQETILFDRTSLSRQTEIDLEEEATCLVSETVVLGRAARGETVRNLDFCDARLIRRTGRIIFAERLRIDNHVLVAGGSAATLNGARAMSTVALIGRGAEAAVDPVRQALDVEGVEAAASGWNGKCVVRIAGPDAWPVRRQVGRILGVLRNAPLPRVWQA